MFATYFKKICISLFSVYGCLTLAIGSGLLLSLHYGMNDFVGVAMFTFLPGFFVGKLLYALHFTRGSAYFALREPKKLGWLKKVSFEKLKMSPWIVLCFIIIAGLIAIIAFPVDDNSRLAAETLDNLNLFSIEAASALLLVVFHWIFWWEDYFHPSEYELKRQISQLIKSGVVTEERVLLIAEEEGEKLVKK